MCIGILNRNKFDHGSAGDMIDSLTGNIFLFAIAFDEFHIYFDIDWFPPLPIAHIIYEWESLFDFSKIEFTCKLILQNLTEMTEVTLKG